MTLGQRKCDQIKEISFTNKYVSFPLEHICYSLALSLNCLLCFDKPRYQQGEGALPLLPMKLRGVGKNCHIHRGRRRRLRC